MKPGVTIVTPFHEARRQNGMLERAAASVRAQTMPVQHILAEDVYRMGAPMTRHYGLMMVETEWTAFLDSDDEMDPDHIEHLVACAQDTGADYVYPWFRVAGGSDPFPMFFGRPWDDEAPHQTTITILVRTGLAQMIGFHQPPEGDTIEGQRGGEDWHFTLSCLAAGAKIVHLPRRSWTWHHHGSNSAGRADWGDANPQAALTARGRRNRRR